MGSDMLETAGVPAHPELDQESGLSIVLTASPAAPEVTVIKTSMAVMLSSTVSRVQSIPLAMLSAMWAAKSINGKHLLLNSL